MLDLSLPSQIPFPFSFSVEVTSCKENLYKLLEYKQGQFVEGNVYE